MNAQEKFEAWVGNKVDNGFDRQSLTDGRAYGVKQMERSVALLKEVVRVQRAEIESLKEARRSER